MTYLRKWANWTIKFPDDLFTPRLVQSGVIPQALEDFILDIRNLQKLSNFTQKHLLRRPSNANSRGGAVCLGTAEILDPRLEIQRELAFGEAHLHTCRVVVPLPAGVEAPEKVRTVNAGQRLLLQVGYHERRIDGE